jgi:hypothetical protein
MATATQNKEAAAKIDETPDPVGTDIETSNLAAGVDVGSILESMNDASKVVTTITGTDIDARIALASALTNSEKLKTKLNTELAVVDYVVTEVTFVSKETGEVVNAPRVVLIDENGDAFHATSMGVLTALRNIRLAVGELWGQKPVRVIPEQKQGNNGWEFITLRVLRG